MLSMSASAGDHSGAEVPRELCDVADHLPVSKKFEFVRVGIS